MISRQYERDSVEKNGKLGPNIAVLKQRSRDQEELYEFLSTNFLGGFHWNFLGHPNLNSITLISIVVNSVPSVGTPWWKTPSSVGRKVSVRLIYKTPINLVNDKVL
jgi:hypothetical protein